MTVLMATSMFTSVLVLGHARVLGRARAPARARARASFRYRTRDRAGGHGRHFYRLPRDRWMKPS